MRHLRSYNGYLVVGNYRCYLTFSNQVFFLLVSNSSRRSFLVVCFINEDRQKPLFATIKLNNISSLVSTTQLQAKQKNMYHAATATISTFLHARNNLKQFSQRNSIAVFVFLLLRISGNKIITWGSLIWGWFFCHQFTMYSASFNVLHNHHVAVDGKVIAIMFALIEKKHYSTCNSFVAYRGTYFNCKLIISYITSLFRWYNI